MQNNPFWEAQIVQINVLPGKEIELVPRVGNHIIYLGKLEHFEDKLKRLKTFYEKGSTRWDGINIRVSAWNLEIRLSAQKETIICKQLNVPLC